MKRLKQTLAIVLTVVMLVATVPFTVNAADKAISFSIATVNENEYNDYMPILQGDKVTVDLKVSRDATDLLTGFVTCFSFDSNALTYGGVTFPDFWTKKQAIEYESDGYYMIYAMTSEPVTEEETVVATITFVASTTFSGTTQITTGMGNNAIIIADEEGISHNNRVTPQGCGITIRTAVNKNALLLKIAQADDLIETDYTANSWAEFSPYLSSAKLVYDDQLATQNDIDTALAELTTAFDVLVERGDLQPLDELVTRANVALRDNKYTEETKQVLSEAIDAAEAVLDKAENASKAEVDEQITLLTAALQGLKTIDLTVKFLNHDGSTFGEPQTVAYGGSATTPAENPVKPSTDEFDYRFDGWEEEYSNVTTDLEIHPIFTPVKRSYDITFYKEDGVTPISTITKEYGYVITEADVPEAPVKPDDEYFYWSFDKWSPEFANVTGPASYTATYKSEVRKYEIEFRNYNGDFLYKYDLGFGEAVADPVTAEHIPTPVKPATDEKTYTFIGWSPSLAAVNGNQVYTAQFSDETNAYTVSFYNWDGTLLKDYSLDYGAAVFDPIVADGLATPTRANDELYSYTFKGWTPELAETVTGPLNYTADFDRELLPASYALVDEQIALADALNPADYTLVSFARVTAAKNAVVRDYTIDKQDDVNAMATAIDNAIKALVSPTEYDKAWDKCAAVTNNDANLYEPDSYTAFRDAMNDIGAKQDFDNELATQAQVDAATKKLNDAFDLLKTATLIIDSTEGKTLILDNTALLISNNTNSITTELFANDGGANTAILAFYDLNGNEVTNQKKSIGTGFKVDLIQGGKIEESKYIVIYGDVDGDGQISISDIALARKIAVSEEGYSEYAIAAAKCGGDTVDINAIINLAKAI